MSRRDRTGHGRGAGAAGVSRHRLPASDTVTNDVSAAGSCHCDVHNGQVHHRVLSYGSGHERPDTLSFYQVVVLFCLPPVCLRPSSCLVLSGFACLRPSSCLVLSGPVCLLPGSCLLDYRQTPTWFPVLTQHRL